VDGIASEVCPVVGFGIRGVEPLGSAITVFVSSTVVQDLDTFTNDVEVNQNEDKDRRFDL